MLKECIQRYLANAKETRDPKRMGLSGAGHCGRQLAYKYHGTEGVPLSWRSKAIFSDGNYIQDQLREWLYGAITPDCFYLADAETEVQLQTPKGRIITGHVDGIIHHRNSTLDVATCKNPEHVTRLLEIKSMSSIGYRMLAKEGLERSYQTQISCYLQALGLSEAIVLCKCKDNSDLTELVYKRNDQLVIEALERFDKVLDSPTPESVYREVEVKDEGELHWRCTYCAFTATCWREFKPAQTGPNKWHLEGDYRNA